MVNIENVTSLSEVALYITEYESRMFESLISLDFAQAVNEAEGSSLKDKASNAWQHIKEVGSNICKKIIEFLTKVGNKIQEIIDRALVKVVEFINDKGFKKFRGFLNNADNWKNFPGVDVEWPRIAVKNDSSSINELKKTLDGLKSNINRIDKGFSKENSESYVANANMFLSMVKDEDKSFEPKEKFVPSAQDMKNAIDYLSSAGAAVKELRSIKANNFIGSILDSFKSSKLFNLFTKKSNDKSNDTPSEEDLKLLEAFNSDISEISRIYTEAINIRIKMLLKACKSYRRVIVAVGGYCIRGAQVRYNKKHINNANANDDWQSGNDDYYDENPSKQHPENRPSNVRDDSEENFDESVSIINMLAEASDMYADNLFAGI